MALVVEHAPRHRRAGVGEHEEAEAAGRPVLQPAQRLDVVAQQSAWYRWVASRHVVEGGVVGGRHALVERVQLQPVALGQPLPVEVGPPLGLA